jgi:hypothetical protein
MTCICNILLEGQKVPGDERYRTGTVRTLPVGSRTMHKPLLTEPHSAIITRLQKAGNEPLRLPPL